MSTKQNTCVICHSTSVVFWGREYKGNNLLLCKNCSVRFVEKFKSDEENKEFYNNYFQPKEINILKRLRKEKYLYLRDFKTIESINNYFNIDHKTKFLDIGTGNGRYLKLLKFLGYDNLSGFDVTNFYQKHLEKLDIKMYFGELDAIPENQKFDVITALHVLEHINSPKQFLVKIINLLNSNGIIYFLVPNEGGVNSKLKSFQSKYLFKPKPYRHLSPGHHSIFYNSSVIKRLFEDTGYSIKFCRGSRSNEKKRGVFGRVLQAILTKFGQNSWLEIVAVKKK